MSRSGALLTLAVVVFSASTAFGAELRLATFRSDVTPAMGEPLIWVKPTTEVLDPLWAKGVILDDGATRVVLCSVDWCGLGGSTHRLFREKIARAAGTELSHVAVHSVHQHAAPYIVGDANKLLAQLPHPPLLMSQAFLERITDQLAAAVKEATTRLQRFDRIGTSKARVDRVASARRILVEGKLVTRYSGGGRDPKLAALPEGPIDPYLRTVTLASGKRPLVRLHFYATHPQTFCCDGRVSGDIVNAAREAVETTDGAFEIYFTGCSGDVTVGKYNDGTVEARRQLAARLRKGMEEAIAATHLAPAGEIHWRTAQLRLPLAKEGPGSPRQRRAVLNTPEGRSGQELYRAAAGVAFAERKEPLDANLLKMGGVSILLLPGEPMLVFQRYALGLRPDEFVVVAGYGDISPGYLCTDEAFRQGGYEPHASRAGPGTEARVKAVIDELLDASR